MENLCLFFLFSIALIKFGVAHGGDGGDPFDDATDLNLSPATPCIGVHLFWNPQYLVALRFIYQQYNPYAPIIYHGDLNKDKSSLLDETFMMEDEERINKIILSVGKNQWYEKSHIIHHVLGIKFYTTAGRVSRHYGSENRNRFTESFEGYILGYAKGKSGSLIDMLQFVWYNNSE